MNLFSFFILTLFFPSFHSSDLVGIVSGFSRFFKNPNQVFYNFRISNICFLIKFATENVTCCLSLSLSLLLPPPPSLFFLSSQRFSRQNKRCYNRENKKRCSILINVLSESTIAKRFCRVKFHSKGIYKSQK